MTADCETVRHSGRGFSCCSSGVCGHAAGFAFSGPALDVQRRHAMPAAAHAALSQFASVHKRMCDRPDWLAQAHASLPVPPLLLHEGSHHGQKEPLLSQPQLWYLAGGCLPRLL